MRISEYIEAFEDTRGTLLSRVSCDVLVRALNNFFFHWDTYTLTHFQAGFNLLWVHAISLAPSVDYALHTLLPMSSKQHSNWKVLAISLSSMGLKYTKSIDIMPCHCLLIVVRG